MVGILLFSRLLEGRVGRFLWILIWICLLESW